MNNKLNFITLSPFKYSCYTIGNLPTSFAESMSYYEGLLWLSDYLKNTVIPAVNNNSEAAKELQEKFLELQNYINNYFSNLDVQEEINNKLDQMAEDGTLLDLLKNYQTTKFYFAPVNNQTTESSGDCSLIKTIGNKTILIDTGVYDSYDNIKNFLNNLNITKIDYFILSHYHGDHQGNLADLMKDFDFSKTICYLQKIPSNTVYKQPYENAQIVLNLLQNNTIVFPNNDEILNVDNLNIRFINCNQLDMDYYAENEYSYNNCSMCCYVKDRFNSFFYTGDIELQAQTRMYNLSLLENCTAYKLEHHSVNGLTDSNYLRCLQPSIAIATNQSHSSFESEIVQTAGVLTVKTLSYLQSLGCKLYFSSFTNTFIEFISDGYSFKCTNDLFYEITQRDNNLQAGTNVIDIYVNPSYTGISKGTINNPFKLINEAIRFGCNRLTSTRINLADGEYDETVYITNLPQKIIIQGNNTSPSNVKIKQLTIFNAKCLLLQDFNMNEIINNAITISQSDVTLSNVIIDGLVQPDNLLDGRGISCYDSSVILNNCIISNKNLAICGFDNANIAVSSLNGENNKYLYVPYYNSIIKSNFTNTDGLTDNFLLKQGGKYFGDKLTKGLLSLQITNNFVLNSLNRINFPWQQKYNINNFAQINEDGSITITKDVKCVAISGMFTLLSGFEANDRIEIAVFQNQYQVFLGYTTNPSSKKQIVIPTQFLFVNKGDIIKVTACDFNTTGLTFEGDFRYNNFNLFSVDIF